VKIRRTIMPTRTLDAATIDRHIRRAHVIRSRAMTRTLGRLPALLRRGARAVTAIFA